MSEIVLTQISLDDRLQAARALLTPKPAEPVSSLRALGTAALAAVSALALAAAVILGPGVEDGPSGAGSATATATVER